MAMISLAAVISNPDSRGVPPMPRPPRPMTIFRKALSFMSRARFQSTLRGSMRESPKWIRLSITAESRLFAAVMAWKSPVNCRLMASEGSRRQAPPPVAPPLRPKTGPMEGCLNARIAFSPIRRRPWAKPMEVVVLPSPAGVGVMAETRMSLPGLRLECADSIASS